VPGLTPGSEAIVEDKPLGWPTYGKHRLTEFAATVVHYTTCVLKNTKLRSNRRSPTIWGTLG
jgi:hypothetical protein